VKTILILTLTLGLILSPTQGSPHPAAPHHEPDWTVYFSPDGGATKARRRS